MFDDRLATNEVVVSLETALKIEMAPELKVAEIVDQAVERLENTYSVKFDKSVFILVDESALTNDQLSLLLRDLLQALSRASFFTDLKLFHKNIGFNLVDINYIGYARENLLTALRYLQDDTMYAKHADEIVTPLYDALNNIGMCTVKRLFIILLMLHRLGISEGVAIIARILYMGGLII